MPSVGAEKQESAAFVREAYKFWKRIETRFADIDANQHVNNVVYFTYFEMVRLDYMGQVGVPGLKVPGKYGPAVISQTCNYRKQVFHPSTLDAGCRAIELRNSSFVVEYELYLKDTDTLVCEGSTVMAWVDFTLPGAIPLPDELTRRIAEFEGVAPEALRV